MSIIRFKLKVDQARRRTLTMDPTDSSPSLPTNSPTHPIVFPSSSTKTKEHVAAKPTPEILAALPRSALFAHLTTPPQICSLDWRLDGDPVQGRYNYRVHG